MVVSDEQIRALKLEAGEAGDSEMVSLCKRALDGASAARLRCAEAISDAQAQCSWLYDYETGDALRVATANEERTSIEAAKHDGGAGVIRVDGVRCYVS